MNAILLSLIQGVFVLALAPLSMGLVRMFKARMQGRKGACPTLPYVTFATLLRKQMVISKSTSWVFRIVPFIVLGTTIFLALVLPLVGVGGVLSTLLSDFILVAAVLAIGAVFLVLGGLDSASAFGGMGSSREMTISSLVEPVIILTFAAFALVFGTTNIDGMLGFQPVLLLSFLSLLLVILAENARYPVDNPATHLELTMVHEAMVLEYSGPYLAMLEYASALKLTVLSLLAANILFPFPLLIVGAGFTTALLALVFTVVKLVVAMFLLALLESSIAKMRFFRMQEYVSIAFFIAFGGLLIVLINLV